jgi:hypothetical protein
MLDRVGESLGLLEERAVLLGRLGRDEEVLHA